MTTRILVSGMLAVLLAMTASAADPSQKDSDGDGISDQHEEILGTDPGSRNDLPSFAKKSGHEYLGEKEEDGFFRFYMKVA